MKNCPTFKYSGIQVFSKTKTHGIHKENFYNNIYNNIIIGLKLHGLPPIKTTEYLNTRIPPSSPETGPHDVRLQTFPRSDKNLEKFFLKHLTTRF